MRLRSARDVIEKQSRSERVRSSNCLGQTCSDCEAVELLIELIGNQSCRSCVYIEMIG